MTPEVEQLRATLDAQRAGVLKKLAGVSEADARRSPVASGTNLAGLVQHLAFVESKWFEGIVAGDVPTGTRSMQVDPSVTLRALCDDYRAACARSNAIVAAIGDADTVLVHAGRSRNLRWAMLAVIEETARHAGHADILREQLDGGTGR